MSTPCDSRLTLVEECIHKCRAALLASDMSLANSNQMDLEQELAEALVKAHDLSGCQDLDRLQEAMSLYEGTLGADSVEHAHRRARALTGLGSALWRQCEFHDEDAMRLNRSIALLREALDISPIGHSARADTLYALALALHTGFEQLGFPEYISESVLLHRDALMLRPLCHPNRDESLNGLAIALDRLFVKQGGLHLLDEAIDLHRQALLLRVPGHPRRATSLNNLAIALQRSFQQRGGRENLAQVIALHREVLTLRMARSPFWAHTSNNLAVALFDYFVYYGGFDALAESTTWARQALLLLPPGNSNRGKWTNNLACALRKTFEQQGNGEALLEAIALHREALFLHPPGHADRDTSLDGLANALQIKSGGSMEDLHDAIALHREALQLRPVSHPLRDETQHHLAMALETSYRRHHSTEILAEAVSLHRQALAVRVNPHPNRHLSLMGLASSLVQFAAASKELHTWEEAASLYEEALTLCPRGHPLRARLYSRLGRCLLTPTSPIFDFDLGVERLLEGLSDGFAPVKERLHGASEDLRAAEQACNSALNDTDTTSQARRHYDMLKLYQEAIQLLPRMANFGMDHQTRYCTLIGSDEISRNAATRALLLGRVSQAVEMLEEGRGIFWSQALRLRASGLDDVPELDRLKLQSLFRALDDGARGLTSASAQQSPAHREQALESQRQLNLQAEALIAQIRSYSGLQRFLMPAAFDMLLRTLPHGFVIIVNASSLGCHALLLSRDHGSVENLELPLPQSLNIELSTIRASLPRDVSSETQNVMAASRAMRICRAEPQGFEDLLAMLWTTVVNPIVRKLGLKRSRRRDRPRAWWCVTGELGCMPLHAAGDYRATLNEDTADYVVSSYIPTLSALTKASTGWRPVKRSDLTGLLVCEASSGARHLPHVAEEVENVRECLQRSSVKVLNEPSEHTTIGQMQSMLERYTPQAHILHLASHGIQDTNALDSAFLLQDGKLSIADIMKLDLPCAVLAFLSACQTAKGDRNAPDQAVHLVASMLFCGFRSVVGTMWCDTSGLPECVVANANDHVRRLMHDKDGPEVARHFYERLLETDHLDLDDIPYALDEAVRTLRDAGVPASRWASFVHMGG